MQYRDIPFYKPSLTEREETALLQVFRSGWLTTGTVALTFEKEFAEVVHAKHALAVSSATAGLHLALLAAGLPQGSGVLVPSYTFAASAHSILHAGYIPVFVDIEKESFNLDLDRVEAILEAPPFALRGLMPVHLAGQGCEMEALRSLAERYDLFVVEDAAHAFPATRDGRTLGTFGDAGVFSFYATKTLTTAEGGMVVTDDDALAKIMRSARLHGINKDAWFRHRSAMQAAYDIEGPGFKYNLPDILAALGRVQLARSQELYERRKVIVSWYRSALADCDFLVVPEDVNDHSWHLFIVRLRLEKLSLGRDAFVQAMQKRGVASSLHFLPLHTTQYFSRWRAPLPLPYSERRYREVISLPLFHDLGKEDVDYVAGVMKEIARS